MGLFKSKEEKEENRKRLSNEFLEYRNLKELSNEDKEYVDGIREDLEYVTSSMIKGSEAEIFQANMLQTLVDQNWLMIKLLNNINTKLDK